MIAEIVNAIIFLLELCWKNDLQKNGGIEKASANLIQFEKTELLEPGDSQTLTLTFEIEDMASYDAKNSRSYVLEEGDYTAFFRRARLSF